MPHLVDFPHLVLILGDDTMPVVLPNEGLADLLAYMIRETISGVSDWELILFVNNITPDQNTELTDLTEATFGGYAPVTITRGTWTAPTIVSDKAVSTWDTVPIEWTCSSGTETVYGYAMYDPDLLVIRVIERFATPQAMSTGAILAVLPRLTLTTEP